MWTKWFKKGQADGSMIQGNPEEYRNFLFGSLFYLHQWYAIKDNESYAHIQPFIEKMIDRMYSTQLQRLQYSNDGFDALDLAYKDLSDAFKIFLQEHNNGKPFFIAGHSQGALHGQRLINEFISQKDSCKNFIAAYLIGYILAKNELVSLILWEQKNLDNQQMQLIFRLLLICMQPNMSKQL